MGACRRSAASFNAEAERFGIFLSAALNGGDNLRRLL
jgi:hypothetical protein